MAYADKKSHEQAEKMYKRAISLDPSNPVAYQNLGNMYRDRGEIDLAIENFNTAIKLDQKFIFSYNALMSLHLENENYQEARKVLESYLDYSGSKVDAFFLLSQIATREGDLPSALDYLEEALTIDPNNRLIQASIINIKDLIKSKR